MSVFMLSCVRIYFQGLFLAPSFNLPLSFWSSSRSFWNWSLIRPTLFLFVRYKRCRWALAYVPDIVRQQSVVKAYWTSASTPSLLFLFIRYISAMSMCTCLYSSPMVRQQSDIKASWTSFYFPLCCFSCSPQSEFPMSVPHRLSFCHGSSRVHLGASAARRLSGFSCFPSCLLSFSCPLSYHFGKFLTPTLGTAHSRMFAESRGCSMHETARLDLGSVQCIFDYFLCAWHAKPLHLTIGRMSLSWMRSGGSHPPSWWPTVGGSLWGVEPQKSGEVMRVARR